MNHRTQPQYSDDTLALSALLASKLYYRALKTLDGGEESDYGELLQQIREFMPHLEQEVNSTHLEGVPAVLEEDSEQLEEQIDGELDHLFSGQNTLRSMKQLEHFRHHRPDGYIVEEGTLSSFLEQLMDSLHLLTTVDSWDKAKTLPLMPAQKFIGEKASPVVSHAIDLAAANAGISSSMD